MKKNEFYKLVIETCSQAFGVPPVGLLRGGRLYGLEKQARAMCFVFLLARFDKDEIARVFSLLDVYCVPKSVVKIKAELEDNDALKSKFDACRAILDGKEVVK